MAQKYQHKRASVVGESGLFFPKCWESQYAFLWFTQQSCGKTPNTLTHNACAFVLVFPHIPRNIKTRGLGHPVVFPPDNIPNKKAFPR